jgi:hypothetical protein
MHQLHELNLKDIDVKKSCFHFSPVGFLITFEGAKRSFAPASLKSNGYGAFLARLNYSIF